MFKALLPVFLIASSAVLFASPGVPSCAAGSLSTYESDYSFPQTSGCSIGILDYSTFGYHAISNAPATSDIFITPTGQGFNFTQTTGTPFVASLGEVVQFEIDYNILIDPAPVIAGADNRLDPPTGNVAVTETFCNDSLYFFQGTCFGSTAEKLSVGTPASGFPYTAAISFQKPALTFQTVGILFTLDGTKGASSFDGFTATTQVNSVAPEPTFTLIAGLFLVAGGSYQWKRGKRNS